MELMLFEVVATVLLLLGHFGIVIWNRVRAKAT